MKKIRILAMLLALLLSLSTAVMAEENALTLSDASVREDETIYLTLRLNTSVIGDTLGISYTFDSAVLEPVLSSCTWSQKGVISNFNKEHAGVWAADQAKDLAGDICVLAFRVKSGVKLTETTVSCKLIIKNGAVSQGTYTAQATVTYACDHTYGDWEPGNEAGHVRACIHCGDSVFQPHSWDSGEMKENPDDPAQDWLVFTCEVCGASYQTEIPKTEQPTQSTQPPAESTAPATVPSMPTMPPETYPVHTEPPTTNATAPTASTNPGGKEPVKQTDPTLPPQETLPRDPEAPTTQSSQETKPAPSEGSKDNASGENDQPTEKDENVGSAPIQGSQGPSENTETARPQDSTTAPTTQPTYPDNSSNVVAKTEPTKETTEPPATTAPTSPYSDYNTAPPQTTRPLIIPVTSAPATLSAEASQDHNHDHDTTPDEEEGDPVVNALMVTAFLAVAFGGAKLYLKKKRK